MKRHAPSKCPVCGYGMHITHLHCERCSTELTGQFSPCRFCVLEEKHMTFIETFLRSRGSIKDVEKALGVSYPTVKNMLESALNALGLDGGGPSDKEGILSLLANGEISAEEAIEKLRRI